MRIHFNPGVVIGDYFYGADGRVRTRQHRPLHQHEDR